MDKIRTGIIGVGFIGRVHIEALRRLGYVEVAAIARRGREAADAAAKELSVPKAYDRVEDLIRDKDIDVVHVTTVNNLHFPYVKLALENGKHVMCEKPLAISSREAAELLALAKKTGRVNGVAHSMRYYPLVKQARMMVRSGEIGDVRLIHGHYLQDWLFNETDYNWRLVSSVSGPSRAVADIGTHWMDMVQHITGQKITAVCADLSTFLPTRKKPKKEIATYSVQKLGPGDYEDVAIDTEDHGSIMLKFSGGAKGMLLVCQTCAGRKNYIHFELNGAKKTLDWNGEEPNQMWIGERGAANGQLIKQPSLFYPEAARYAFSPEGLGEGYLDTFRGIFSDMYAAVRGAAVRGGKPFDPAQADFPTFLTGLQELQVVDAIFESHAKQGQWVEVKYRDGAEAAYR